MKFPIRNKSVKIFVLVLIVAAIVMMVTRLPNDKSKSEFALKETASEVVIPKTSVNFSTNISASDYFKNNCVDTEKPLIVDHPVRSLSDNQVSIQTILEAAISNPKEFIKAAKNGRRAYPLLRFLYCALDCHLGRTRFQKNLLKGCPRK